MEECRKCGPLRCRRNKRLLMRFETSAEAVECMFIYNVVASYIFMPSLMTHPIGSRGIAAKQIPIQV